MPELILEKGLPANLDAERAVLGSLQLDHQPHAEALTLLTADDFSIEKHRRIFAGMMAIDRAGGQIDRVTLASHLRDRGQLESVDGLSYLVDLDEGLPQSASIEGYVEIVKEKAALRRIIFAAQDLQNRCLGAGENSAEIIAGAECTLAKIGYKPDTATTELLNPGDVVEKAGGLQKFLNPEQGAGVKTPWRQLTEMTCGYRRGELIVFAGNPSMGKSAAALQIAMGVAESGRGALIVSLEMSRESLIRRAACMRARVDGAKFRSGYVSQEERLRLTRAVSEISKWPLWIAEHGISTVAGIRSALRKKRAQHDVFLVAIDYLQLMKAVGRFQNRNAEVSEITRALKLLAVEEDVNVHLLSQLTRDNMREKRPPALHDLRDSGSIEQDADAVAFVWRPEILHRDREDLRGMAELILAKQRNGPVGKIELVWQAPFTKFESRAEGREEVE